MNKRVLDWSLYIAAVLVLLVPFWRPSRAKAIPAFSRQYNTSCSTCHLDFPKLNDFGKAFKDAGFKFPQDDESMVKIPPVMLGAPAQAELWPHSIWPGKIPGQPPIGLRMNTFFQVVGKNANNFQVAPNPAQTSTGTFVPAVPATVPRTDFETGFFSIFTAGNFGSDIAFWVDDDISVSGANSNGSLGDAYLRFVNVSRLMHLPKDSLSLRVGQFELDLPFSQARSWNISPWDVYTQSNFGAAGLQNVANQSAISDAAQGIEISGGHHTGGYWYSLAVVNQNTSAGANIANTNFVPSATGGNNGGVGFQSDSNFKDLYANFMYRFNFERDKESRNAVQAAGKMGPRDHTYLSLGTFYQYGRSVNRMVGVASDLTTPAVLTAREPFYRVGGDFSFNYRTFNLFGLLMFGHDHNLLPVGTGGTPFPASPAPVVGFVRGSPSTFTGGFLQADYLVLPWTMLIMRYDAVNSHADYVNGLTSTIGTPFFGPVSETRNRFTPGVQFLIHANIKTSFEYQIRPRQQIPAGVNPITGAPVAPVLPFRTNTATAGLEWVY
jgi:hypothetical protein